MAYTVLARRYRSGTFDEVVGQNHIAQTLKKAISSDRLAHAYLFCGTRGTGKTSTARIFARCLNCLSSDKPVTEPCNKCDSCRAISRGEDIDVIEIDAASNTGVDNVRDTIIANAYNTPARGRFKIFIIDEVHMLSKNAFNALLKTLEEPPSHVKFILATTEPEKVLPTILSRCQRYDFRNIPTREIAGHLRTIVDAEKIEADDDALMLVAKAGAGSMRDSLSLLDRLLSVGETRLTVDLLESMLGLPKSQLLFDLVQAIGGGDVKGALSQADSMISNGLSVDSLIASLIDHLRNLMIIRTCGLESGLVEVPGLPPKELAAQAGQFDAAALSQDVVILEELRRHVRQSQAGRALLDATLVRMSLADQFSSLTDLLSKAAGLPAGAVGEKKNGSELAASGAHRTEPSGSAAGSSRIVESAPVEVVHPAKEDPAAEPLGSVPAPRNVPMPTANLSSDLDDDDDDLPAPGKVWEGPKESLATMMARSSIGSAPAAEPSNVEPVAGRDLEAMMETVRAALKESSPGIFGLLQEGRLVRIEDGKAVVRYSRQNESHVKLLERNGKKDVVRDAFSRAFEQPLGVVFTIGEEEAPAAKPVSPQQVSRPVPAARPPVPVPAPAPPPAVEATPTVRLTDEIRASLYKNDPLVRAIVDQLGGSVIKLEE
jgi:DNA polymerase-3 subunit gamma/tau